jgi:hypothetical protein
MPLSAPDDDALLAALRRLATELDPVPPDTVVAARAGFAWLTLDAELAELVADADYHTGAGRETDRALAGVRSARVSRAMTFEAQGITITVEALDDGDRRRIVGQLVPRQPALIEVAHAKGTVSVTADDLGRFLAKDVAPGPMSLRVRGTAGGATVTTDWVVV